MSVVWGFVATNFSEPHRVYLEAVESAFGMEIFVTVGDNWTWGAATTSAN